MPGHLDVRENEWVAQTMATVESRLRAQQAGHGMDHVLRVLRHARAIQSEVGGNRFVIELSALLHDVGDAKFHNGLELSGEFSRQILTDLQVPSDVIQQVVTIVDNISFRKHGVAQKLSIEGEIVQDADRLDALGAIGIVRTIEYGAVMGQPFHVAGNLAALKTGVAHFYEKLFKLRDLMNTEPGRRLAIQREEFMRSFLDQYFSECI
jgi:uncharacterized protein